MSTLLRIRIGSSLISAVLLLSLGMPLAAQAEEFSATALGNAAYDGGDYESAEQYYLAAVHEFGEVHDVAYAEALGHLGTCYYMSGKFAAAAALYRDLIKLDEQLHGSDSLQVASDLFGLTGSLRRQYLWDEASPVIQRTLDIRRKALGENHKLVAMSWMDLAVNYQRSGKLPEAENAFLKTIAIREKMPPDSAMVAPAYHLYAKLLKQMDRMPDAQLFERRAEQLNPNFADEPL